MRARIADHIRDAEILDEAYRSERMPAHVAEAFETCIYFIEREQRADELRARLKILRPRDMGNVEQR